MRFPTGAAPTALHAIAASLVFALTGLDSLADTLRFADGREIEGAWRREEAGVVVFVSVRHGELRVPAEMVTVRRDLAPVAGPAHSSAASAREGTDPAPAPHAPAWRGRLAFATETASAPDSRAAFSAELRLEHETERHEIRLEPRYELRREEDETRDDKLRVNGYARRTLGERWFLLYRPAFELNRASFVRGVAADYWYLAHELGGGREFGPEEDRVVRLGATANLCQIAFYDLDAELDIHGGALFCEAEWLLPASIRLRDLLQFVHYPRFDQSGVTNELELTKKLTDSLSLSLRHKYRRVVPDPRIESYRRLRLLLGYAF
ncbi:MAG: DUF481 domain-containing protein [Opitutaceae bacterium]|nr:DUF481 domain-containing protein [Opitutaceae bacterium]